MRRSALVPLDYVPDDAAYTLGMIQAPEETLGQSYFDLAVDQLASGAATPIPLYDIKRPGDVEVLANAPTDTNPSPICKYSTCPDGYQAFCQLCDSCSDSWALCRPKATPSTNGLPYAPFLPAMKGYWRDAIANAAAAWYAHGDSNLNDANADPTVLQPFLDHANAWFWGVRPYITGTGPFTDAVGGGSTANQLPWNQVPWRAIPLAAWAWLAQYEGTIDWDQVKALNLPVAVPANVESPDVDWMDDVDHAKGFYEAPAAWRKTAIVKAIPWGMRDWTVIPWMQIPWGVIDWPSIHSTADLVAALSPFQESPTTQYLTCVEFCNAVHGGQPCFQVCKDKFPDANYAAKACTGGAVMRSDGSCAPPSEPGGFQQVGPNFGNQGQEPGGFQQVDPIFGNQGLPGPPAQLPPTSCEDGSALVGGVCQKLADPSDPGAGCAPGEVKLASGACKKPDVVPPPDEGMGTGTKVVLAGATLGLGWIALKYLKIL